MNQLIDENRRLRNGSNDRDLDDKRQNEQLRSLLAQKETSINKQKSEWAEIYGKMKHEIDDFKRDISMLNQENDRLLKQLEMNDKGARS